MSASHQGDGVPVGLGTSAHAALRGRTLGWVPQITLQDMVSEMVISDLADAQRHALLKHHGYAVAVTGEH